MATFTDARQAIEVLRTHIVDALADDYEEDFSSYGGADVIIADEEELAQQVGKPYIRLEPQGSEDAGETWGRGAWRVRVTATVTATGSSGAIIGAANTTASDTLLGRALKAIVRDGYATLRDAGLYACKATDPRETTTENEGIVHQNAHTIEFIYFDSD